MAKNVVVLALTLLFLFGCISSSSATFAAKIVNGVLSNAVSILTKWVGSLKASTKTAISASIVKFEGGYTVETVFDGSKLGIEPYSVEVLPNGELLILDSANCNIYKISSSLSVYSRPRLVAGSAEGYSGHVDGKLREARMNRPKGLTVDDRGNIYIADTENAAIRKISDTRVTTIAGGKWGRGGGHVDGPGEDAKLSNDFDVVYLGSSCSLLVIDRGNQVIREIQLQFDDCAYQYGTSFPTGIAVLVAAGFFGYMLALLQHRVSTIVSSKNVSRTNASMQLNPYQKPVKSVWPPLIQSEYEQEKQEEGFFGSLGKLLSNAWAAIMEISGRKTMRRQMHSNDWAVQESFVIPDEDEPPSIESRTPTPRKTYPFMSKDAEKIHQLRQTRAFYNGWESDFQQPPLKQQHRNLYHSSTPHTYYEQSPENIKD